MRRRLLFIALCASLLACAIGAGPTQAAEAVNHSSLFEVRVFRTFSGAEESLDDPCGVAVDSSGDIYVGDYYADQVVVFPTSGGLPQAVTALLRNEEPLDGPCAVAVAASGKLYVNNYHRNVTAFTPTQFPPSGESPYGAGSVIDSGNAPSTSPALRPTGLAIDPATGRIYVDDRTYVAVYEPSGAAVTVGGEPLKIGLDPTVDYYGLAVSGYAATAGYLYVANAATGRIEAFDPATSTTSPVAEIDGEGTPQGGFSDLTDAALAVDSVDGHIFVASYAEGALFEHPPAALDEFNSAGDFRGRILASELIAGGPSGLAVSPPGAPTAGDLYVTSGNSERGKLFGLAPTGAAHTLRVSRTGTGTVTSQPAGIRCGGACTAEFNAGAQVTLTATPAAGSAFAGWSGGGCSVMLTCQVSMTEDHEVSAAFEPAPAAPSVVPTPGSGTATTAAGSATSLAAPAQGSSSAPSLASSTGSAATRHRAQGRKHRRHRRQTHRHRGR